ncbi:MAG: heme exporter protein CcmB [Anaerolineales bacterium]|nr:heme exporter protein CcmB [Anaerolineales bacterium]
MSSDVNLAAQPVVMQLGGGPLAYLRKIGAVCAKDLRAELRGREVFSTMTAFSVLAVLIFGMGFDLRVPRSEMIAPGVLWVVILFTGVLGLNRSFGAEVDRGTLPALLLAPVDRSAIYFGKLLANLFFTLATTLVILAVMFFIFDLNMFHPYNLLAVLLGVLGYVGVGTIFAALTASSRARDDAAHPVAAGHGAGFRRRHRADRGGGRWQTVRRSAPVVWHSGGVRFDFYCGGIFTLRLDLGGCIKEAMWVQRH